MALRISTAVIAAAGSATRMWPASKVIPKELFPVGRVPAIIHLLWELLDAGIQRVLIVTSGYAGSLLGQLLDRNIPRPSKLRGDPLVGRFEDAIARAQCEIVIQRGPYGNGTPLVSAASLLEDEPIIYAFGDDVVFGENVSSGLVATYEECECPVLAAQQVAPSRTHLFGILECDQRRGLSYVSRLLEKPAPGATTSTLASFGRYVVTPDLLSVLRRTPVGRSGELWFSDAVVKALRDQQPVCAFSLTKGRWYTIGDPIGYVGATRAALRALDRRG